MTYTFHGKTYADIFALAKDFYLASDEAGAALRSGAMLPFLRENAPEKTEKVQKLSLLSLPDDVFVFKASYVLNPYMSFRIKGYVFEDYALLGRTMLSYAPSFDPVLLSMVRYHLLSEQMESGGKREEDPELYRKVREIEESPDEDLVSYYSLGYLLSGKQTILYKNVEYQDLYNLTYFLCKSEKDLDSLGAYLAFSPLLKAYARYGKEKEITESYLHLCEETEKSETRLRDFLARRKKKEGLPS
jgi:hypothetical protein